MFLLPFNLRFHCDVKCCIHNVPTFCTRVSGIPSFLSRFFEMPLPEYQMIFFPVSTCAMNFSVTDISIAQ
jgi:hypothetical protein